MRTRGARQGPVEIRARPLPGSSAGSRALRRRSLPRPPLSPAAPRAPQRSPAPKVSLMHLESASGSPVCVTWRRPPLRGAQRARNREAATLLGAASALSAAARDLVLPRPRRLRWPLPPLAPARAAVASAAVVPVVAAPLAAAAAAHGTVSGALAVVRGKCLQYFFYTGPFRASGAPAQRTRHTLLICIGRRPRPPRGPTRLCGALCGGPCGGPSGRRARGPYLSVRTYTGRVFVHILYLGTVFRSQTFFLFFPKKRDT